MPPRDRSPYPSAILILGRRQRATRLQLVAGIHGGTLSVNEDLIPVAQHGQPNPRLPDPVLDREPERELQQQEWAVETGGQSESQRSREPRIDLVEDDLLPAAKHLYIGRPSNPQLGCEPDNL